MKMSKEKRGIHIAQKREKRNIKSMGRVQSNYSQGWGDKSRMHPLQPKTKNPQEWRHNIVYSAIEGLC